MYRINKIINKTGQPPILSLTQKCNVFNYRYVHVAAFSSPAMYLCGIHNFAYFLFQNRGDFLFCNKLN